MLEHKFEEVTLPKRVVILGGSGFVGGAIAKSLRVKDIDVFTLGSVNVDLTKDGSNKALVQKIKNDDVVVAASAIAPAKNLDDLKSNIEIIKNIHSGVEEAQPCHFINIGSDAVFSDGPLPLNETSSKAPDSFHGIMHLTREAAFAQLNIPVVTIRPTLIYGKEDPHNGYGPNRFAKLAVANEEIQLFGEGEEKRDHIFIEDVAELAVQTILHRSVGSINAVTGLVYSFKEIASLIVEEAQSSSTIKGTKRIGKMPHDGLRTFDNTQVFQAFPAFQFTPLTNGLATFFD